jgi:hypothetical protein
MFNRCDIDRNGEIEQRTFGYFLLALHGVCTVYSRHVCKLSFEITDFARTIPYNTKQKQRNTKPFTSQFINYAAVNKWKVVLLFASTHICPHMPSPLNFWLASVLNDSRYSLQSRWSQHRMTVASSTQIFWYISVHIPAHNT